MRNDPDQAAEVMLAAGLQPLVAYPGANGPWPCRCLRCNREVAPHYSSVAAGQGGCRYCAAFGIDLAAPAIIYLIASESLSAAKVGITSTASRYDRVAHHIDNGWTLVRRWDVPTGADADDIENTILDWWRDELDAPDAVTAADMPQGGHTETASLVLVDIDETVARIDAAVEQLSD